MMPRDKSYRCVINLPTNGSSDGHCLREVKVIKKQSVDLVPLVATVKTLWRRFTLPDQGTRPTVIKVFSVNSEAPSAPGGD